MGRRASSVQNPGYFQPAVSLLELIYTFIFHR